MLHNPHRSLTRRATARYTRLAVALFAGAFWLLPAAANPGAPDARPGGWGPHAGQPQEAQPAGQDYLQDPAPEWVVPGARITLYSQVATTLKKNDPENPRVPVGGTSYEQYDIIAVTPDGVLIAQRSYQVPLNQTRPMLMDTRVYLADTGSGGHLWVPASELANLTATTDPDANPKVEFAPFQVEGETYDAIHITKRVDNGRTTIRRIYDKRTAIILYQSESNENDERLIVVTSEYRGYRVAELPWQGGTYTDRVRGFNGLVYDMYTTKQTPGFPDQTIGHEFTFAIGQSTDTVLHVGVTMRGQAQGNAPPINDTPREPAPQTLSAGQRMGLYIAPDVLNQLERGQLLDEDPAVGYTIRVTDVYQVDGVTLVEITEQGPGNSYTVACTYDASVGLMVASTQRLPAMQLIRETVLQRVE